MRIIGIDPGIEKTGFAVMELNSGKISVLDFGYIKTDKKDAFAFRLRQLAEDLRSILKRWKPNGAGLEQIFFSKNVKTAMTVAHARGVILETLEEHGVSTLEFNPGQIKLAVTGDAKADKLQVKKMIQCTLGLSPKNDDAADALACGICTIVSSKILL